METSSEKMGNVYARWQDSGLSRMAFCKQENINYATFNYWHKRFSPKVQMGFTEIPLHQESDFSAELIFPSGVRMIFNPTPPIPWLKELLG